ncbi:hypothetical protein GCM10022286_05570 [Gryllotalpicola daejeonensis]|uniref:Tail fiber protein n=1 Tax=Gryllotalpicola daejeonensis TaxID=993087 RepID=A0ABP7ZFC1_9MICO
MSALGDIRQGVADLLASATGRRALPYVPDNFQPPCWIIDAGSPYVSPGDQFGTTKFTFDAIYLARDAASNAFVSADLDDITETGMGALAGAGWVVGSVDGGTYTLGGNVYTGVSLSIAQSISTTAGDAGSWIELSNSDGAVRYGVGSTGGESAALNSLTFQAASGTGSLGLSSKTSSEYEFAIEAPQVFAAGSLWRFAFDNAGTALPFRYSPDGNETASEDHPHLTGTVYLPAYPTAGGDADNPNRTFALTLALMDEPEVVTA